MPVPPHHSGETGIPEIEHRMRIGRVIREGELLASRVCQIPLIDEGELAHEESDTD
jgi:hypothetical protein